MLDTILQGDVRECLKQLEEGSVQCCITSPPYWGLRDYGCDGQIGLEPTPEAYVADLVEVFREVKRVLRNDGVLWLNLGDSYCGSCSGGIEDGKAAQHGTGATVLGRDRPSKVIAGLKPKDLVGIPWMVAFALRADGWYLRSDIIWNKLNPMPESVTDRCTKSHEYIFMLTKSERYYYDAEAIKEESVTGDPRTPYGSQGSLGRHGENYGKVRESVKRGGFNGKTNELEGREAFRAVTETRNKRDVWTVATQPCAEAHFATFPPKLIEPMILAGTSEKGCCPKCGKPWERITEPLIEAKHTGDTESAYPEGTTANRLALLRQAAREQGIEYTGARKTIGWQPGCYCGTERRIPKEELKADPSLMGPAIRPFDPVPCTILDPFMGSGTTAIQAVRWHRHYLGCELNPEYVKMAERRIADMVGPLFVGDANGSQT